MPMGKEIEQGEEDREEFLHAKDSVEGPFAVVLYDWGNHRGISSNSTVRHDMLTSIIAFGRTGPKHEAEMES